MMIFEPAATGSRIRATAIAEAPSGNNDKCFSVNPVFDFAENFQAFHCRILYQRNVNGHDIGATENNAMINIDALMMPMKLGRIRLPISMKFNQRYAHAPGHDIMPLPKPSMC